MLVSMFAFLPETSLEITIAYMKEVYSSWFIIYCFYSGTHSNYYSVFIMIMNMIN